MDLVQRVDEGALGWFMLRRADWLDAIMVPITHLGDRKTLIVVAALGVILFLSWRRYRSAVLLALTTGVSFAVVEGGKHWVGRLRPEVSDPLLPVPTTGSFPSGHTLAATAVYVAFALLLASRWRRPWPGLLLFGVSLMLAFLIGFSRLYIGHHYVTDVIAGWSAGLALALVCYLVNRRFEQC